MKMQSFMGLLFSHQDWGAERLGLPRPAVVLKEWDAIRAEKRSSWNTSRRASHERIRQSTRKDPSFAAAALDS